LQLPHSSILIGQLLNFLLEEVLITIGSDTDRWARFKLFYEMD